MYDFCLLFILFLSYSIMGWFLECIHCSIRSKKLTYDRGMLLGPYCPIYGMGGIIIYLFLTKYQNDPIALFLLAAVGTSILEYITSFLLEKIFKARWWDYSHKPFNIEGRICLENAILFGILAMIFIYIVNPVFIEFIKNINKDVLKIVSIITMILFTIDMVLSFTIITRLKIKVNKINKDRTTELDKQIKEELNNYRFYIKKLFKSFPKIRFIDNINDDIRNKLIELSKIKEKKKK